MVESLRMMPKELLWGLLAPDYWTEQIVTRKNTCLLLSQFCVSLEALKNLDFYQVLMRITGSHEPRDTSLFQFIVVQNRLWPESSASALAFLDETRVFSPGSDRSAMNWTDSNTYRSPVLWRDSSYFVWPVYLQPTGTLSALNWKAGSLAGMCSTEVVEREEILAPWASPCVWDVPDL